MFFVLTGIKGEPGEIISVKTYVNVNLTCSYTGKDIQSGKLSPQIFLKSSLLRDPRSLISAACGEK